MEIRRPLQSVERVGGAARRCRLIHEYGRISADLSQSVERVGVAWPFPSFIVDHSGPLWTIVVDHFAKIREFRVFLDHCRPFWTIVDHCRRPFWTIVDWTDHCRRPFWSPCSSEDLQRPSQAAQRPSQALQLTILDHLNSS